MTSSAASCDSAVKLTTDSYQFWLAHKNLRASFQSHKQFSRKVQEYGDAFSKSSSICSFVVNFFSDFVGVMVFSLCYKVQCAAYKVQGATKCMVLQSTWCYKIQGVTKYMVLQSAWRYNIQVATKYMALQNAWCYKVQCATKCMVLQYAGCYKVIVATKCMVLQSAWCYNMQVATK